MNDKLIIAQARSPIGAYDYVALDRPGRPSVSLYEGRPCYIESEVRVRNPHGGYYNRVVVQFLDQSEARSMGAAAFLRKAKSAPLSMVQS